MTPIEEQIEWLTWLSSTVAVRFSIVPTLDKDSEDRPFCRWQDDKRTIDRWAQVNLKNRYQVFLGREDAEHFSCTSVEFAIQCTGSDAERVRKHWIENDPSLP